MYVQFDDRYRYFCVVSYIMYLASSFLAIVTFIGNYSTYFSDDVFCNCN